MGDDTQCYFYLQNYTVFKQILANLKVNENKPQGLALIKLYIEESLFKGKRNLL